MNKALQMMFWGYLFVFFRIHFGFDLLADPIGYYLLYAGSARLIDQYPHARKAKIAAGLGIVISFPSIFINLSEVHHSGWEMYGSALLVLKLIVAYFIFAVLKSIVHDFADRALISRTNRVFNFYIGIHLLALFLSSFSTNVSGDLWIAFPFILGLGVVIMDIAFLLLLGAIRRNAPAHRYDLSV
ncbi:hypothetical protein ACFPRA_11280 [Sporosarcina soli]|uniref:Membrane protein DUF2306 n=1 Tax=Sporosarcina soli TaxID=334736 RepID=A0ABW0TJ52_9BACL